MLLMISGYDLSSMHDFIIGVSTAQARQVREMPGGLITNDTFVIVIVAVLTFLIGSHYARPSAASGRPIND